MTGSTFGWYEYTASWKKFTTSGPVLAPSTVFAYITAEVPNIRFGVYTLPWSLNKTTCDGT